MIFGESGSLKTFLMVDAGLTVAAEHPPLASAIASSKAGFCSSSARVRPGCRSA